MESLPPLRLLHSEQTFATRRYLLSLEYWRGQTTESIVRSLLPKSADPGYQEFLKVRDDGLIFQGNTRVKVLQERGYNLDLLPRHRLDS